MCCLEIKKFGIVCVNLNGEIESRNDCFSWKKDNDRVPEGPVQTLEIKAETFNKLECLCSVLFRRCICYILGAKLK